MYIMIYLFSYDIQNSLRALYVSNFYTCVGEHNKNMSSKKYLQSNHKRPKIKVKYYCLLGLFFINVMITCLR
jgi:hypothetical protein